MQTVLPHLKNTDLVGGAKAVFICPQDAVTQVLISLKVQHGIHHMLQHLGSRNVAIFVDMPHYKQRDLLSLAGINEQQRRFSHLRYAAR